MSTIIKPGINGMRPVHPGEILREEYLRPLNLTASGLAVALRVAQARIDEIVEERGCVTAETALRLARYFGGDAKSWLNLQQTYDLKIAETTMRPQLAEIEPYRPS